MFFFFQVTIKVLQKPQILEEQMASKQPVVNCMHQFKLFFACFPKI